MARKRKTDAGAKRLFRDPSGQGDLFEKSLEEELEEKALAYLGEGWIGEEAVALALYSFMRYPDDYEKVIIRGANTNGDSDSIACIGGSISGAYLGIDAIPEDWVKRIEKSDYLDDLATRLAEKKGMLIG